MAFSIAGDAPGECVLLTRVIAADDKHVPGARRPAIAYAAGGYHVICDGIVGPWFIDVSRAAATGRSIPKHYVIRRLNQATTLRRAVSRASHALTDPEPIRSLHRQFTDQRIRTSRPRLHTAQPASHSRRGPARHGRRHLPPPTTIASDQIKSINPQLLTIALDDFVACYNPANRHERTETERFRPFSYDELAARDSRERQGVPGHLLAPRRIAGGRRQPARSRADRLRDRRGPAGGPGPVRRNCSISQSGGRHDRLTSACSRRPRRYPITGCGTAATMKLARHCSL
jgi:hypothetical protein